MRRKNKMNVLPVTNNDARRRKKKATRGVLRLLLQIIGLGIGVVIFQRLLLKRVVHRSQESFQVPEFPLQKFSSLEYALKNSQIVGLYFAASWCPMSTPVTQLLDETFGDILNPPKDEALLQREGFSLVYVSSDRSESDMKDYIRRNWWTVPWESEDRQNLKRHYLTCAKPEMELLGIDERVREIPTLIIVSGESQQVLTFDGVKDVKEHGGQAIDRWMKLDDISEALEHEDEETA